MPKIPWEVTFMQTAQLFAARSHCLQIKVGSVIANMKPGEEIILSAGYNGPPRKIQHCDNPEIGCSRRDEHGNKRPEGYCKGAHGEINAIGNAASHGIKIRDATLFVTISPCLECAKHILNYGIEKVIYLQTYSEIFPDKREEDERALNYLGRRIVCCQFKSLYPQFDLLSNPPGIPLRKKQRKRKRK